MHLAAYLDRIGLTGPVAPDLGGLRAIHRAQAFAIPYEAIDVHLGRPVSQGPMAIFDKLVTRRRGGWCYEMNGLLGWALREFGFEVRRAVAGVHRRERGPQAEGNHVALIVTLPEGEYLADLGVADFLREPIPLRVGTIRQDSMEFRVTREADGWWRVTNDPSAIPEDFDLHDGPADEALIAAQHRFLRDDPASPFVQNFEVIAMRPGGRGEMVIGRVLTERDGAEKRERLIVDAEELDHILRTRFGLVVPDVAQGWPRILARHAQIFGAPDAPV